MILMVCVDDRGGLLFHGRRQSQDRLVRQDILRQAAGHTLWMNAYSAKLFAGQTGAIRVSETCLDDAGEGEYCLIENLDVSGHLGRAEGLVLYCWNRHYPADVYWNVPLDSGEWRKTESAEFPGSSHEKITKEVYLHEKMS